MASIKARDISDVIDLTIPDSDEPDHVEDADDSDIEIISAFPQSYKVKVVQDEPVVKEERTSDGSEMVEAGPSCKRARDATKSRSPDKYKRIKGISVQGVKEDDLNSENHEDAMRAAAERRRSTSKRIGSGSPVRTNATAGPGPKTLAHRRPSPNTSAVQPCSVPPHQTASRSTSPKAASLTPFQETSGEPGSFGHAVPLVAVRARATSKPVSLPAPGDWGNPVPMKIGTGIAEARETSLPSIGAGQARTRTPNTTPPVRRAQTFLPNPIPYVAVPAALPPSRRIPTWSTDAAAVTDVIDQILDTAAGAAASSTAAVAPTGIEAGRDISMDNEMAVTGQTAEPGPICQTLPPVVEPSASAKAEVDHAPVGPTSSTQSQTNTDAITAPIAPPSTARPNPTESSTSSTAISSQPNVPREQPMWEEMLLDPRLRDMARKERPDLVLPRSLAELEESAMNGHSAEPAEPSTSNAVTRQRASSHETDDSIQEISAEIAMSQDAFKSRLPREAAKATVNGTTSQPIIELTDADVEEIDTTLPSLRDRAIRREGSASTLASLSSPSKRQSNRLAARTETPVYSFKTYTHEPIRWRQTVELDGDSVDVLVRQNGSSSSDTSTTPSTLIINGLERTVIKTFNMPIIDKPPPPERASRAVRDFDTTLIDKWNKISPTLTHNPALHRMIFQSHIEASVGGQEPVINVINKVDVEPIPPNFEFQYSNTVMYHKSAPEPELGQGCGCEGPCGEGPRSTCSCLQRQRLYNYNVIDGFAYNQDGTLKAPDIPIWECGPNCGCPPECRNRVVQKGRQKDTCIDLFKTRRKGWGVKARNTIPAGTFLGVYSGELISELESERRGRLYAIVGRTYLFDCDGWHIKNPPQGLHEVDPRLAELAYASAARARQEAEENDNDNYNAYSVDAFHYGFTRYFNHSCDPNLAISPAYVYDYHPERPLLVIFTRRDVKAGDELCISYKGIPDEEEEIVDVKRGKKHTKTKKSKTTSTAHVSSNKKNVKANECYCGAWNCDGIMFPMGDSSETSG